MKVIYLTHCLSFGDPKKNACDAAVMGARIAHELGVAVVADWIWMSAVLTETSANRAMGLRCDKELVSRCDELWLVGPKFTPGMKQEFDVATARGIWVGDFVGLTLTEIKAILADDGWTNEQP